ncbi:phage integrase [Calothrix sp. NIES-2100]|uniref:tyrosine-type recombinase/integrase n=1 Tax=Calothrix sp. NIES-2100 TaxID=1954172 RepID=UPI000B5E233B|nr:phage integrase [Calothrix sp. NIES-2100]
MVNTAKTPTGKAPKGEISIRVNGASVIASFPRTHFPSEKNQVRKSIGISSVNFDPNDKRIKLLQDTLQVDMESGKLDDGTGHFNEIRYQQILRDLHFISDLKAASKSQAVATTVNDQAPPKPELSLLEVWDMYCEYRKPGLRESHYENFFKGRYQSFLESAMEATKSEDALKIRNWLVENRNLQTVKNVISNLSKAYQLGIKNKVLSHNPYEGMTDDLGKIGAKGKTQDEIEADDDTEDQSKAYTWEEVQAILDYIKSAPAKKHWYHFTKFKFLTGCRTGEAIALRWNDIDWSNERVLIRTTFNQTTKKFYPLKNDKTYKGSEVRRFPMPKDGELWNLLKSIPQGEPSDVVFKSKTGKIINNNVFRDTWQGRTDQGNKGIISELIKQGKLTKYLSPYNTRHTFINHAIHDLGIPEKVVCYMCGHKPDVSNKHYQDEAIFMKGINPEITFSQQQFGLQTIDNQKSEIELLREQNEQLRRLVEEMRNKQ